MEEDEDKYRRYANLPIPTYEEATSSRPTSSNGFRGAQEVSDDAERQGLLGQGGRTSHHPPSAESPRSSEDSNLDLPEVVIGGDGDYDRRQIEELDYLDPSDDASPNRGLYHRARLRQFSKRLAHISASISSLRLPSFRSLYSPVNHDETPIHPSSVTIDNAPSIPPRPRRRWWLPQLPQFSNPFHIPEHYKISAPIFARLFGLFIMAAVIYTLFALDMFPGARRNMRPNYEPEAVRIFVQENVDSASIAESLRHITSYDHVAGTEGDYYLANWMYDAWVEEDVFDEVALLDNYVYLNYHTHEGRSVKILEPEGKRWTAQVEENLVDRQKQQTLAWHGHSKSGEAKGHLIYANGGSREDFEWLQEHGVETEGAIALIRYFSTQRNAALKIKAAEKAGCIGALLFSDPDKDGEGRGEVWPDGPFRPADSVQREGVGLTNWIIGDPLTPGWASKKDSKTVTKESSPGLPQIPSLPLPWRDAKVLIEALHGQGVEVPSRWVGGTGGNERWFSGSKDGDNAPVVELRNHNDENTKQQIWNVHGLIRGIEAPKQKIMVGSHHDSWCFGSVDPGSASAVMMEVVSIFAQLRAAQWQPLRSIQFVSWDASAFNLIGSTEFVEDQADSLREHGVAYLNVDVGVWGQDFHAAASPIWRRALNHVMGRVSDPATNETIRKLWNTGGKELGNIGGVEGDFVPFQNIAGMSSIDFGFKGARHAYPRHSCYETFEWMQSFGDPDFSYHRKLAEIWALLILEIADRPILPFDVVHYADEIGGYVAQLQDEAERIYSEQHPRTNAVARRLKEREGFDLALLRDAAANLTRNVRTFHEFEDAWTSRPMVQHSPFGNNRWSSESNADFLARIEYNDKLVHFERDLLDLPQDGDDKEDHGIPGREQYKHIIFGPGEWDARGTTFPAVRQAMEKGDWEGAMVQVEKAARIVARAGRNLVDD